jgi:hypothetical protein
MATHGLPSLNAILLEARSERHAQLLHFDALDAKAGVVLGFAAALVALSPDRIGTFATMGRVLAVASGLAALSAFWPRRYWLTDLRALRAKYLTAEEAFTNLNILDATVAEAAQVRTVLIWKSRLLKLAMLLLASAVVSTSSALA